MQITKHAVATIEYTLADDDGDVIDTSSGREPLAYVHGVGALVPGLESELEGRSAGDSFKIRILPKDGYGVRHENLVQEVPRNRLPPDPDPEVGMQLRATSEEGQDFVLTIVAIEGDTIRLDGNHPLAGVPLNFSVEVVSVRAATKEEIAHGHVHGPGGHAH